MASKQNIASLWFRASEETGDFMGIRYGRITRGSDEPEWIFVSHCECDGIGGFARLLRERGVEIAELPQTKQPFRGVIRPLWNLCRINRNSSACADRTDWNFSAIARLDAPTAVAWHLFSEAETEEMIVKCRAKKLTVNSLLLKHLDQAVRPEINRPNLKIPWMIPVNLRGDINHADDTENHVSCVGVSIAPDDSTHKIHQQILRRLALGEHRANHLILGLGRFLNHQTKMRLLTDERSKPAGNIGAFSNLGVWDAGKRIDTNDSWLFCPPVVTSQLLGAGCVTFQNRLALTIQPHPGHPTPDIATIWMNRWVEGIGSFSPQSPQ